MPKIGMHAAGAVDIFALGTLPEDLPFVEYQHDHSDRRH